ncbi:unnamed protein product [Vitrella brassicaformis CCMP3155]|uniref:Uncharacterized protein n=1 Tax=Vitrella brassicaformis (strain CCMP3155) TaxID=1169540 RepID=A0A0G4F6Y9_VITBC|nr:unnamed protein product [Vitrella brassicaformis CCMP3155]|eukprot:CEM07778.1 unnamed protein product [Vitrella brassicaformis CCMP3155]
MALGGSRSSLCVSCLCAVWKVLTECFARMSDSVPDDLWHRRIIPSLLVHEAVCVRGTCRAKAPMVTAALLVERIDGSLARHPLTGLIDIDRTAPLPFTYVLRAAYVLEQGSDEWPGMGRLIRLAAIYRLTPANGLPLVLSAQWLTAHLPSRTAFHQLPLAMAIYRLFGHLFTQHTQPGAAASRQRTVSDWQHDLSCGAVG